MSKPEVNLDRLLRAAAKQDEPALETPFGFATRVVALANMRTPGNAAASSELARLVRRIAVSALVVTVFAGSAAFWQLRENEQFTEPFANAYALADNAIASEFSP